MEYSEENLFEPLGLPTSCLKVWVKPGMGTAAGDGDPGGCMKGSPNTRQCCFLGTSSLTKSVTKFLFLVSPRSELNPVVFIIVYMMGGL